MTFLLLLLAGIGAVFFLPLLPALIFLLLALYGALKFAESLLRPPTKPTPPNDRNPPPAPPVASPPPSPRKTP